MTDDERREDVSDETASSSDADESPERSAADITSRVDPVERWGDPESRWGNPEKDLPNIPRVRIPGEGSDEGLKSEFEDDVPEFTADIDPEQTRIFWASVVLANIGVAGVALGPMLIYFRGEVLIGAGVTLLGVGALVRVYYMYREYTERDWSSDDEATEANDSESAEADDSGSSDSDDTTHDTSERNR